MKRQLDFILFNLRYNFRTSPFLLNKPITIEFDFGLPLNCSYSKYNSNKYLLYYLILN